MTFNIFATEEKIIEKNNTLLELSDSTIDYFDAFTDLLEEYKKLFKISSRIVSMSDRNQKHLMSAKETIQSQQGLLEIAHQELKISSEHRLKSIIEATPVSIIISELKNNKIIYANKSANPLLGLENSHLMGLKFFDFFVETANAQYLQEKLVHDSKVDHFEISIKNHQGDLLWLDISICHLDFNDLPCYLCSCNDITHLKEFNIAARRFVPEEYLSFFKKNSLVDIKLGDHVSDEMSVMFSDLRSFTSISENMTPQQNFDFVNDYLAQVSPCIRNHNGFIVKYLGDGIMAIFPNSADDAVQAGIKKLQQINQFNQQLIEKNCQTIKLGIGVNTGHMMVGMVGEEGRMQGDAFSDNVNLTSRLESLTKFYHVSFIITQATKDALNKNSTYNIRYLDKVQVKGKMNELDIYEVFDADSPEILLLKQQTLDSYKLAMKYYFEKKFPAAQSLLFEVLQKNPKDKVAWYHLMNTTRHIDVGIPDSWTGINIMTSK